MGSIGIETDDNRRKKMKAKKAIDEMIDKRYSIEELSLLDTEVRIYALETALATHLRYHFGGVTPPK
jgi:aspartyl aminopeptidase